MLTLYRYTTNSTRSVQDNLVPLAGSFPAFCHVLYSMQVQVFSMACFILVIETKTMIMTVLVC